MPDLDPSELVVSLAEGYVGSRCLHVIANLGVCDVVSDEPRSMPEIARELGVDAQALGRVVRHLASLGVFAMRGDDVWHNEASRLLRQEHPGGLLPLTRLLALPIIWDSFKTLEDAVRTGRPGATFHDPNGFFAYLDAHPQESDIYDQGMTAMTTRRISKVVPCFDFSEFNVIADIGGGRGHLLRAVLEGAPGARGVLFDRAQVADGLGSTDLISVQVGDFFADPLPVADCYLLSNIIHDWSDPDALAILTAVRAAAPPTSTLLLFEFVVPEDAGQFEASDIDVEMLALVGGRERTLKEYTDLLAAGGWRLQRTVPTASQTILEAAPIRS
ncbi:MAG: methyltransferase [Mycobacteriales bacterium]